MLLCLPGSLKSRKRRSQRGVSWEMISWWARPWRIGTRRVIQRRDMRSRRVQKTSTVTQTEINYCCACVREHTSSHPTSHAVSLTLELKDPQFTDHAFQQAILLPRVFCVCSNSWDWIPRCKMLFLDTEMCILTFRIVYSTQRIP